MITMKEIKKAKIIGSIIGVILFIILVAGFTYAWFTWESNKINISGNTACFDINYTEGNAVTDDLLLIDANKLVTLDKITIKKGMAVTNLSAGKDPKCTKLNAKLIINLNVVEVSSAYSSSGSSSGALHYVVASYDASTYPVVSSTELEGIEFDILETGTITSTGEIKAYEKELNSDGTIDNYLIIFYIDGNQASNDVDNTNLNIKIEAVASQI